MNSTSVNTPERRHSAAKKKTVNSPLAAMFHHSQLPAMPFAATKPVTASGVSTANVVATIDVPVSHHGAFPPETKEVAHVLRAAGKVDADPEIDCEERRDHEDVDTGQVHGERFRAHRPRTCR